MKKQENPASVDQASEHAGNGGIIPPEEYRWKPGESGNPEGRKKGLRNRETVVREIMETMTDEKNPLTRKAEKHDQQFWVTLALLLKARKGDLSAWDKLMDSMHGKLPDRLINETPPLALVKFFGEEPHGDPRTKDSRG